MLHLPYHAAQEYDSPFWLIFFYLVQKPVSACTKKQPAKHPAQNAVHHTTCPQIPPQQAPLPTTVITPPQTDSTLELSLAQLGGAWQTSSMLLPTGSMRKAA